jgi:hypothetical protein
MRVLSDLLSTHWRYNMLCITIKQDNDGYLLISVTDHDGAVCSYGGYDGKPRNWLLAEYGIDL